MIKQAFRCGRIYQRNNWFHPSLRKAHRIAAGIIGNRFPVIRGRFVFPGFIIRATHRFCLVPCWQRRSSRHPPWRRWPAPQQSCFWAIPAAKSSHATVPSTKTARELLAALEIGTDFVCDNFRGCWFFTPTVDSEPLKTKNHPLEWFSLWRLKQDSNLWHRG